MTRTNLLIGCLAWIKVLSAWWLFRLTERPITLSDYLKRQLEETKRDFQRMRDNIMRVYSDYEFQWVHPIFKEEVWVHEEETVFEEKAAEFVASLQKLPEDFRDIHVGQPYQESEEGPFVVAVSYNYRRVFLYAVVNDLKELELLLGMNMGYYVSAQDPLGLEGKVLWLEVLE
jgi:hypothetical protein